VGLSHHGSHVLANYVRREGERLMGAGVCVWDVGKGRVVACLDDPADPAYQSALSGDGRRWAHVTKNGTVKVQPLVLPGH
jgi:hypothetical protein